MTLTPADEPIRVAVTIDDLFQWKGIPFPDGYSAHTVARSLATAFDRHDITSVYAFSNTLPVDDAPELLDVFDQWCADGHHIGNHTHHHASLNWMKASTYIGDIERTEEIIRPWTDLAPTRYFRYCFDMWGNSAAKTQQVNNHLVAAGFTPAPITIWFYDAEFLAAYWRTLRAGDTEGQRRVQDLLVDTAVAQLREQVRATRTALGRQPPHILLMHGSAVVGDTIDRVLDAYLEEGVEFISLDEAMRDPFTASGPPVATPKYRSLAQKWAEYAGVHLDGINPLALDEIETIAASKGLSRAEVLGTAFWRGARGLGTIPKATDFYDKFPLDDPRFRSYLRGLVALEARASIARLRGR